MLTRTHTHTHKLVFFFINYYVIIMGTLCCVLIIIFGLVRLERFVSSLCHSVDESPPVKINDNNIMMYVV